MRKTHLLIAFLSIAIVFSGCKSWNGTTKGGLIGGGAGAVIGAGAGLLFGKDAKSAGIGAAVGTAVGATTDVIIGTQMDKAAEKAAAIEGAKVDTITDANNLKAVKVTFESGILFEQSLIQDELPLRRQATADFWRRHCYPLPLPVAQAICAVWSGPESLLADLSPYLHGEAPQLRHSPSEDDILKRHLQNIERIEDAKQQ